MNMQKDNMIEGVTMTPIAQIPDSRGTVRKFITSGDMENGFQECYTTTIYRGIIKGLHGYKSKTIYYCVPVGVVKLVLWDNRINEANGYRSSTFGQVMEVFVGVENFIRVSIPPGVMNAFQGIAETSLAVVVADEVFDEEKTIRMLWNDPRFPYDWNKIT